MSKCWPNLWLARSNRMSTDANFLRLIGNFVEQRVQLAVQKATEPLLQEITTLKGQLAAYQGSLDLSMLVEITDLDDIKASWLNDVKDLIPVLPTVKDGADGAPGQDGANGADGKDGVDGKDAD